MNQLTKFLVNSILQEETLDTVALFGGGFKPPTKGHLEVVLLGLKENPEVKQVYILVGSGERNGVTQEEAVKIWEMYQKFIPVASQIIPVQSPFSYIKTYLEEHQDEKVYIFIGARPDNKKDDKDVAERSAFAKKYSKNVIPVRVQTTGGVSGTMARKAALSGNNEEFITYFPSELTDAEKQEIIDMISSVVKEDISFEKKRDLVKKIIKMARSTGDLTSIDRLADMIASKITIDSPQKPAAGSFKVIGGKPFVENATYSNSIDIIEKCAELTNYMKELGMPIEPLPSVEFIDGDTENAKDFFGKTAYYDPNEKKIVLYTEGRHPKDIVRSFAHEMIHHMQNLEDRLGDITTTNTQEDDKLNDIEAEANLKGTMTFRNWTDSLQEKKNKDPFGLNQYARELAQGLEEEQAPSIQNQLKTKYSEVLEKLFLFPSKDGKYMELNLIKIKPEFKNQGWATKILDDLVDWAKENNITLTLTPSDTFGANEKRLEKFYKRFGFKPNKGKNRDFQTRDSMILKEGTYDSLVTKLTKTTINKWVEDSKKKPRPKKSFVDIDVDDIDGKGREIEFNYVGLVEFTNKVDGYEVDGTSNSGEEEDKIPFIATLFKINPKVLPQAWSKISADVSDVIRHEIEHLTQAGENVRSGKYKEDDIQIRDMINKLKILPPKNYYMLDKEVDAMLQGLYLKAKKSKKPFADVVNNYLDVAPGIETPEDKEMILNLWRSRRKALSLPLFENDMPDNTADLFTIYLDMDGVIVNFDKQFEKLTGMGPREFESSFGKDKFWEKIDKAGVGFWRGMEWMPGGKELYDRVSKHKHFLLSAPSQDESSKIGKRLWRKANTPSTRLILSSAKNKPNYADKSNILIDDRADTIDAWKANGGIGILYKSAGQVMKELDKLGL